MEADSSGGMGIVGMLFMLAFIGLMIASAWKVFTKAGQPGWAAIIPIYNMFVMLKIIGKPWWWLLGMLIPFLNFIVMIVIAVQLAKVFGKGIGFAVGLILLSFVFYPILAFGDAKYTAPPPAA
ncbi:MAG: DUF5684 domain-containing protein [Usitatibacteraceae bacterium]